MYICTVLKPITVHVFSNRVSRTGKSKTNSFTISFKALNFDLEGTQQFPSGEGHFYEETINLYWNFAKGTTAKAQQCTINCWGCHVFFFFRPAFRAKVFHGKFSTMPSLSHVLINLWTLILPVLCGPFKQFKIRSNCCNAGHHTKHRCSIGLRCRLD